MHGQGGSCSPVLAGYEHWREQTARGTLNVCLSVCLVCPHPLLITPSPTWPLQNSLESTGAGLPKHDEEDEDMREKEVQMESLICAFETLGKAWPRSPETQRKSSHSGNQTNRGRREGPRDHVGYGKAYGEVHGYVGKNRMFSLARQNVQSSFLSFRNL